MSKVDLVVIGVTTAWLLFHLVAAVANWRVVVDPPKHLWLVYPASFFRTFMKPHQVRVFTILVSSGALVAMALIVRSWSLWT